MRVPVGGGGGGGPGDMSQGKKGGSEKRPAKHTCLVSSSELSTLGPND